MSGRIEGIASNLTDCLGNGLWVVFSELGERVSQVASVTFDWLKSAGGVKNLVAKPLDLGRQWINITGIQVTPATQKMLEAGSSAKTVISATEIFTKIPGVLSALPQYTIFCPESGDMRGAPLWEQTTKKAAQVADWAMSACDFSECLRNYGLTHPGKEWLKLTTWIQSVSGLVNSAQGLIEEGAKWICGRIIDARRGMAHGMETADYLQSFMKIAMNVAYLGVAVIGLATLFGYAIPNLVVVRTVLLTVASITTIFNYYIKNIAVRQELRGIV